MSLCPKCDTRLKEGEPRCAHCGFSVEDPGQNRSTTFFEAPTEFPPPEERNQATQPSDPLIGRILDSKYKLVARLGAGGMGIVYRAQRLHIGDEIVVKVLSSNLVNDEQALERFRREARAAAMLHHPNIVTIHDFGDARGMDAPAYIVMEMVRGSSLREVLKKERRLDMERAVRLMRQVCAGVGAAHLNGVVHRDLKPDNIIVLPPGLNDYYETVKVVDFGIAKLRDALVTSVLTPYGHTMGTPHYMSPEQWRGKEVDARSDVYSLGCVFYEMLAGSTPFRSESFEGMLTSHLFEAPPPLPPELDARPVEAVYLRSLSKQPDLRQQDATLLARELKEALQFQQKEAEKQLRAQEAARTVETRTKEEQRYTGRPQIDEAAHARAAEKIRLIEEERRQEEQRRRKISEAGRAAEPHRRNDEHDAASPRPRKQTGAITSGPVFFRCLFSLEFR
jgi:serine/threonine-protein kinase